ncbi:MAG TPA: hypothetical protein VGV35_20540 [Bryobacteraceae bacterium]|nr:hypothetical protein [Bryobacteraceae bacterium]
MSRAQTGIITTLAGVTPVSGDPVRGFSGDGDAGILAALALANVQNGCDPNQYEQTVHLSVDANGNIFFADSNNQRIRKMTPQGIISTVAGNGARTEINSNCEPTATLADNQPALSTTFYNPGDALALPNGNLVIADQQDNRIRQVTPDGVITTIAGNGRHNLYAPGVAATSSPMDWPNALAVDSKGVIYFAEIHGYRVGKIASDGKFATVAGTGFPGYNGDNIQATKANLGKPAGIAVDASGNLYIADQTNHRIRKVNPGGVISTIAGTGQPGFGGDGGDATAAAINTPMDVKVDSRGNIYIADMLNHRVRRIDPNGNITTLAGTGAAARGPDGVDATTSSLNFPAGLALDSNDDLYIVDWQNYLIRRVSFQPRAALFSGGVVNAASFTTPVAPGSLISIFGANLASSTMTASSAPWPTKLGDTSVQVNGVSVPVYFASSGQINAQLPYEIMPGTQIVSVTNSIGLGDAIPFSVAAAGCGIFQYVGGSRGIVLNQDGTLNSPANPEVRGNVVVAFLTGQGAVSPAVPTGQVAPATSLSTAVQNFTATIGGAAAAIQFLGLTPGFIGLAQANILVPTNATTGDAVNLAISASNTVTISVR